MDPWPGGEAGGRGQRARGFALLVERSADPIVIVDELGAVSYANPSVERVLGYRVDEIVPNALDLLHPDEVEEAVARIAAVAQGEPANELVMRRVRHADGRWIWCETVNTNLLAEPTVGGVVIVLRDVTERLEAEARADVEHRLTQTILDTTTALVVHVDMEGRLLSMNRAAERLTGFATAEVAGEHVSRFVPIEERILAPGPMAVADVPTVHENHWTHRSGRRHLMAWNNAVLFDADGQPTGVVATGIDVTAERRAERAARRADRREHDRLAYEATHDALTQVLNRAGLLDELDAQLREAPPGQPTAVLFLDLDGFKAINDEHGHHVGDEVLKVVSERLVDAVRTTDVVGRLGGDEFVVLCPGLDAQRAIATAQRIGEAIDAPMLVGELPLACGVSTGVVSAVGGDAATLLHQADLAMYEVKRAHHEARRPATLDNGPVDPNESVRLSVLRRLGLLDSDADPFVDTIVQLAAQVCGTPMAAVSLIDADRQWFKASVGLDVLETPRSEAFCAHAILDATETFVVPDATEDDRFRENPLVTAEEGIRYYAGAPITVGGEAAIGSLCVLDRTPRTLTVEQVGTLERLRDSLVTYLELTAPEGTFAGVGTEARTGVLLGAVRGA
ncbi:diguanylate cyclase [Aquihabitans sp. G128]|uniref:diguanylate cyclase domain-containing protein n=1 Tax=Aquihabitans sp. G128 TaxID=2849779 RepID=UPI001C24D857|nr:diguanylate cyclase [Aquihabitans sp. G128]QXC61407.1 diguanylate cyclase [Aquihabitans sp. G128]